MASGTKEQLREADKPSVIICDLGAIGSVSSKVTRTEHIYNTHQYPNSSQENLLTNDSESTSRRCVIHDSCDSTGIIASIIEANRGE